MNQHESTSVPGHILASFSVGKSNREKGLSFEASPDYEVYQHGPDSLLRRTPGGAYYAEDVWAFRLSDPEVRRRGEIVLEVEFLDQGLGIIAAQRLIDPEFNGQYAGSSRAVSFTRVNSGAYRRAAFAFDKAPGNGDASEKPDFTLTGIQHLRAVRVLADVSDAYWDELRESIPSEVTPVVTLRRPMELVCSADGALSGTRPYSGDCVPQLRESLPLAKALGFNAVESYVRWNYVEPELGKFDWAIYDTIVDELERHGLKWFPLLIVGSAYTLPQWFYESDENVGFVCLEHGLGNSIQSIWSPYHQKHVTRFLQAFGAHYEPRGCLQGVRLGPSGNFGESQYPAGGNWGYSGEKMHIHIGMWAGDPYAQEDLRRWLKEKYGAIERLNEAWECAFEEYEEICPLLPQQCISKRQRVDICAWYTDSMSGWCEWWAIEARKAMPNTPIYQSAGGWGATQIGTDYTAQAKSMLKLDGGIRLTNELDSFHQCFYATRLGATAARLYDMPLGFEPAMGHTARGVAGRAFNCITNNGAHFFTYYPNVCAQQTAIETWLRDYHLFDIRQNPLVEVALYYPQTANFLQSDAFRYLNAWGFNPYAREVRDHIEVDYLDDRLIDDGFLDRYKVLVFVWGETVERAVLEKIDQWLRNGGTIIFPYFLNMRLRTVEDDGGVFERWLRGDVAAGSFHRYRGDDEPPSLYAAFVRSVLLEHPALAPPTRVALEMARPQGVFLSAQEDGHLLALNFRDDPAVISHPSIGRIEVAPYAIERIAISEKGGRD